MARNRKRAKERRARRPQPVAARSRAGREESPAGPIEHATPDVELAEAQLAMGRPEPEPERPEAVEPELEQPEAVEAELQQPEAVEAELQQPEAVEAELQQPEAVEAERARFDGDLDGGPPAPSGAAEIVARPGIAIERRPHLGNRLITFLQGSWHELQRVQWPDRRQVMQATGVVIGFVIVAGVFLGVADFLAGKLMNYILK